MLDRSQNMIWRPFYFANLIVDPKDENSVYKPDGSLIVSNDGGKSFSNISGGAHGDFHDVWIDPDEHRSSDHRRRRRALVLVRRRQSHGGRRRICPSRSSIT